MDTVVTTSIPCMSKYQFFNTTQKSSDMELETVTCPHGQKNYSTNYFCNARVAELGKNCPEKKFGCMVIIFKHLDHWSKYNTSPDSAVFVDNDG